MCHRSLEDSPLRFKNHLLISRVSKLDIVSQGAHKVKKKKDEGLKENPHDYSHFFIKMEKLDREEENGDYDSSGNLG